MSRTILSVSPIQVAPPEQKLIAPLWHTIVLVLVILGLSANSYLQTRRIASGGGMSGELRLTGYLTNIIALWGLVAYVSWPLRRRGNPAEGDQRQVVHCARSLARPWNCLARFGGLLCRGAGRRGGSPRP